MSNELYLLAIKNPFEKKPFILCFDNKRTFELPNIKLILNYEIIYAYDSELCLDIIRKSHLTDLPFFHDIKTLIKLKTGLPKKEFHSKNIPWNIINLLKNLVNENTLNSLKQLVSFKTNNFSTLTNKMRMEIMLAFKSMYKTNFDSLKQEEKKRYLNIESRLYNIFFHAQLKGISVSRIKLNQLIETLKNKSYKAAKEIELNYGLNVSLINSSLEFDDIFAHLKDYEIEDELKYNIWETINLLSESLKFCELLTSYNETRHDYNELLKYSINRDDKIFVEYDIVGTVTSRIQITKPGIQYLKKENRVFFTPSFGKELIYADFAQFEPGIVASFSGDGKLLKYYNKGDIYNELSTLLFGTVSKRKFVKVIFLSFIYGMKIEKILKLIESMSDKETSQKASIFFSEFKILKKWKEDFTDTCKKQGYSKSIKGNYRYYYNSKNIHEIERWGPNQFVQGTASYIFKKSLLDLYDMHPEVNFLIPMHDAILLEVEKNLVPNIKKSIELIFNRNFQAICKNIKSEIKFDTF